MTHKTFTSLRDDDRVHIPSCNGRMLDTVVLGIDHLFGKVTVLLGRKPYSYRYVRAGVAPSGKGGLCVGLCDS